MMILEKTIEDISPREIRIRKILNERYPSSPLLIPVRDVADMLGVPQRTIYGQVKRNTFFIPHRMIHRSLMVDVEDFVHWYVDNPGSDTALGKEPLVALLNQEKRETLSMDPLRDAMLNILKEREKNPEEWLRKMRRRH